MSSKVWSKVYRRVWRDAKFRRLSQDAQLLWFRLMTAPELTPIPGVLPIGRAALAEDLEWSTERLEERFRELSRGGFAMVDWGARLVWLPKAIKYDPPANYNIVRSWEAPWDLVPECPLKDEIWRALMEHMEGRGDGFVNRFRDYCPNHSGNRCRNQEQEQEQEQEQKQHARTREPGPDTTLPPLGGDSLLRLLWREWDQGHGKHRAVPAGNMAAHHRALSQIADTVLRYAEQHGKDPESVARSLMSHVWSDPWLREDPKGRRMGIDHVARRIGTYLDGMHGGGPKQAEPGPTHEELLAIR